MTAADPSATATATVDSTTNAGAGAGTPQDEWIFSVRVPAQAVVVENDTVVTTTTTDSTLPRRLVQLRQSQPPRQVNADEKAARTRTSSSSPEPQQERVSLLSDTPQQQKQHPSSSIATSPIEGWSLTSPFWSLQSDELLTIAYRPAWRAIPEYTGQSSCTRRMSCLLTCCARPCCSNGAVAFESYTDTFTVDDIVRVETTTTSNTTNTIIEGVGPCQSVKFHLRPLLLTDDLAVPPYWRTAWERHVERMTDTANHHGDATESTTTTTTTGITPVLTFCLPISQVDPPLLWKVELSSAADQPPLAIESMTVMDGCITTAATDTHPRGSNSSSKHAAPPTHIYIQGYQSWSFTGSLARGQAQPQPALPDAFSRAFNAGGAPPPVDSTVVTAADNNDNSELPASQQGTRHKYRYQSDFFTCITSDGKVPTWKSSRQEKEFPYQQLDETGGPAVLAGWLAQHQQFGVISVDKALERLQMHCSLQGQVLLPGRSIQTDWAYAQLVAPHSYDEEPMAPFLHSVAGHNHARPLQNGSLLTGWCSWYHYYENIDVDNLRENFVKLAAMRTKVPTNVAVVDDGYMTAWGDWDSLKPDKFPPEGLGVVAGDIVKNGMRPGVWLAPFAADKHSQVVKDHPDWIIRNDSGLPANSSNCGKFFYGLDATNPAVREHVRQAIHRAVHEWDFNVLKIDFLYAACLEGNGKFDLSMSRAQAMHLALQTIRDAAGPDVFLIGCGCPIGSAVGLVDGNRISADTGPTFLAAFPLPHWDHGTLPCLRAMLRNSITRAPMGHRWWHNDPDCLLLGESTRLTDEEVASAASIVAMTCGMMLLSDDLTKVSVSRMRTLTKIFPMTGVTAVVLDLHSTNNHLPSLLRLWCTDKYDFVDSFRNSVSLDDGTDPDHNAEATFFARRSSFKPGVALPPPSDRNRSCVHVTKGLGTWTVVSLSNWSNAPALVHVPPPALLPPPKTGWGPEATDAFLGEGAAEDTTSQYGYHVFSFWSSKYTWIPNHDQAKEQGLDVTISKKMAAHETEIFHSKPVTPDAPQYIGSDLHFSCGQEVRLFRVSKNSVHIQLKTEYNRVGSVFVFVPTTNTEGIKATVNGEKGEWTTVGNTPKMNGRGSPRVSGRIIRVMVEVHGNGTPLDGQINIDF